MTDLEMHIYIETGVQGGISTMSKCKVDPTTCSVVEGYHSRKQTNYITDLDKNIAYGWTLSLPLPKSDFKRLASVGVLLRRLLKPFTIYFPTGILKCCTS